MALQDGANAAEMSGIEVEERRGSRHTCLHFPTPGAHEYRAANAPGCALRNSGERVPPTRAQVVKPSPMNLLSVEVGLNCINLGTAPAPV